MVKMLWEQPPPRKNNNTDFARQVQELQDAPGNWARVETKVRSRNFASKWRKAGCDIETRINTDGSFNIWARWPKDSKGK